jgi:hypothetical protein
MAGMRRLSPHLLLLLVLLPGCGTTVTRTVVVTARPQPSPPPVLVSPAAFVLTLGDVGGTFVQSASAEHSNSQVAATYHLSAAELRRRGRITSYETEFKRQQATGILGIDDVVAAWQTPAGARWDFHRVVAQILSSKPRPQGVQSLSVPGLGDQRRAIAFHAPRQPSDLIDYAFVFVRGRYRAYIQIVAKAGTTGDAEVARFAYIVDRRIQRVTH